MKSSPNELTIDKIVEISADLDAEFRRQASLYAWLSSDYVHALDSTRRLKNQLAMLKADLADKGRDHYKNDRVTKDVIEGWVIRRPEYQKLLKDLFAAQLTEDRLGEGLTALGHKKSALENLAANMRREWESATREPVVRGGDSFLSKKR